VLSHGRSYCEWTIASFVKRNEQNRPQRYSVMP
jgi:hypothetical protein